MKKLYVFLFLALILLSGCNKKTADTDNRLNVMVSVLPQVDFVQRIGGDRVKVQAMIPPGFEPHTYDPSPEQVKNLAEADLYVRIGHVTFEESQMSTFEQINPEMLVVDSSQGVQLRTLESHSHEHEDEEEGGLDPHIWLDPNLVKIQAENIYQALLDLRPDDQDYFLANKNKFISDLDALDAKLQESFAPIARQTILVFHPAFGYLADSYGFHQEAIEVEGKDPTIESLQSIIDEAKADGVRVIFVQKQFSTKSAQVVAEAIGGAVVQIDPLAQDYFANLENMAYTISISLQ